MIYDIVTWKVFCSTRLLCASFFFFFNDTATTEIYTLSLHDALPIFHSPLTPSAFLTLRTSPGTPHCIEANRSPYGDCRSEEHTSELQSRLHLVCRLLLEKKKRDMRV